ncbi:coiled-coil domain-containing protein 13-like isoform X2 [Acropora millepora]|uniref:coiled-coil domain-containing protein 13-like isoform X2 n=1 Tax=Acropora millepora TaxID=45264 RepID=UPI001CF59A3B|nr:coiled-coil domain-containing protein 13-like isoform X2 [Acropora millepora]
MNLERSKVLRHEFQLIQEQQKRKLLARKQRKTRTADQTTQENDIESGTENYWGHNGDSDNLDLKLDTTVSNGDEIFVQKEIDELKDVVRVLKDENGRLYKLLGERDEEMRILRKARDEEKRALAGTGVAADTAASRIMELSKKNRELTADLESERSKVRQLAKKSQEMEKEVLAKEVGEGFNIGSLLNDSSGWRGRQQQIISLQNKVSELKGQLSQVVRSGSATTNNIFVRSAIMSSPSSAPSQYDEKHRSALKRMEKDRKDAHEKTQSELVNLEQEHTKLQQKHDAAKARNKVLASELKGLKAQVQTLLEKGSHDDELIAALMREQQQLKSVASKKGPASVVTTPQFEALTKDLKQTCQERDIRIQQLEQELAKVTLELKTTTEKYREFAERESKSVACSTEDLLTTDESARRSAQFYGIAAQENRSPLQHGFANGLIEEPRGPRPQSTEYFGPRNNGYEMHRKQEAPEGPVRNQTPSVCGSPARRNVLSRASVQGLSGRSSAQGYQLPPTPPSAGRGSRGRRNSAGGSEEIQLLRSQVQESKSLCQAAEVERDRLLELVSVLQRRLDEAKNYELEATNKWQQERRQVAHIEKKMNKIQSGQCVAKGKAKGYSSASGIHDSRAKVTDDLEELSTRLAIQTDENDALKEALNSTLRAKEEDLKYYQEMIEQTKKIFLQGLRQFRQNSAPS